MASAARAGHAAEALVIALRAEAFAAREVYEHAEARRAIDEAIRVAKRQKLTSRLAEVLITRAAIHLEMGRSTAARHDLDAASRAAGPSERAEVDFATGLFHDTTGDLEAAVRAYRQVLEAATDTRPDLRFKAMNNLGLVLLRLADYDEAERVLGAALELAESFSPMYVGYATESRAAAAIERGSPVEAMRRYEHAEVVLRDTGIQLVDLYLGKANTLLSLRLLDEASEAAQRAIDQVAGLVGGSLMFAECLLTQSRVSLARGDLDAAADAAKHAEDLFRRQRRFGWRARAALIHSTVEWKRGVTSPALADRLARIEQAMRRLGNVPAMTDAALLHGEVAAALGRQRRARAAFERATTAARGPVLLRLRGRLAAARSAELEGNTRRLSQVCRVGLIELAEYRATFASAELRARAAAHGAVLAELGLRAAVRTRRPESVWTWMERARTLVAVREGAADAADEVLPELTLLRGLERDLADLPPDDVTEQADLLRRITQTERHIRNRTWTQRSGAAVVTTPSIATMRSLRSELTDRALVQYAVLDGRILGIAATPASIRIKELPLLDEVDSAGRQLAFALRRLGQPRSPASVRAAFGSARHELGRLSAMLTDPFRDVIGAAGEVAVVPPPELIGVPWGALPSLTDTAVRVVPTATLWAMTRDRRPATDDVVLIAGPDLPGADAEVAAIASCYEDPQTITGPDATAAAVCESASGARIVHLACHGRLRHDASAFSSLRMADGPLTVYDLERLERGAHHWVLAACDLGSPASLVGPELDGVLATLLYGGSAGVVAAVVSIPDLETSEVMADLHGALAAGVSLARAVKHARDNVDASDPAGFVARVAFSCYGGG